MAVISISLVRWACLLSVLFHAIMSVDAESSSAVPRTRVLTAEDLIRVRASTDERKSTVVEWEGQVLSYKPGEQPGVIFNVRGMNVVRAKKLRNGGYDLLGRELQLYLDPVTNEVLHVWKNPYSGNTVPVVHVANNPVYQNFAAAGTYTARALPGGAYTFHLSIPLAYPNPLNPTASPDSCFYPYTGPYQAKYAAIESFTFTFPGSELANKRSNSVPSMQVYWTRTSPLLPFMATPNTNTSLLFIATGAKVEEGWRGLHPTIRNVIQTTVPAYKEAPTERLSSGSGISSWSYFGKPEVFSAYLAGARFPLRDPPL